MRCFHCTVIFVLVSLCCQLGKASNSTSHLSTTTATINVTPTTTLTSSNHVSSTHHMTTSLYHMTSSSKAPSPTPNPVPDFLSFKDENIYLKIHDISIAFYSSNYTNLTATSIEGMRFLNDTPDGSRSFKRFYGTENNPRFVIAFYFQQSTSEDDPNWYLSNLQHAYIKDKKWQTLFQYSGIQYSIWAPSSLQYQCSNVVVHGRGGGVDGNAIGTSINITGISLQPFLEGKTPSSDIFDCAHHSRNNETIGLVVGLSLSIVVVIAAIVIIISILLAKKFSNRGYDILKD